MKKSDLKEWMVVRLRNGEYYLVTKNSLDNETGYLNLSSYNEDLLMEYRGDKKWDILEVYKLETSENFLFYFNKKIFTSIWKRDETIELTIDQIAEKFGVDVENIKIKK